VVLRQGATYAARRQGLVALSIGALFLVVYGTLALLRHESYHSFGLDLGLFEQVFWNTAQGRPFESTLSLGLPAPHSLLGDHFSPVFLLLMPFYFAYPHPETLLVIQTLALALGAWPVYLLARLKLPDGFAPMWVLVYFLFIPVAYINLDDFHEVALAVAPLGFALYFLERGRRLWFVVFLVLTFLIKEEMSFVGAGFGLYAVLGRRDWKLGLGVLAGSLATFAFVIEVAIPYFAGGRTYFYFAERYPGLGGSPFGIIHTALTDPLRIVRTLIVPKKIYFLIAIFAPVLGLSAVSGWAAMLPLPVLTYLLLSNYEPQFSFVGQYAAPLIPLVIGTAIIGMSRLPPPSRRYVAAGVAASSLIFSWAYGYLPFSRKFDPGMFQTPTRYAAFLPALNQIAPDASVSAEGGLTSHLADRRLLYEYTYQRTQGAEWVVLDYEGTAYRIGVFEQQVREVEALGYREVASGYGLSLLHRS
jgi:uncharacterized membrane protein